ncbi:hypothetical protein WR25_02474 [Diploscapter pachys]|uniref:EGF-like domain-containing protein n=1 Tax=Diploscapter pachys TaxID=2018661 RepID=A0A2A2JEM0_9BILA|nr:hypothetical protein WR25_02474 [Diploscapter pachys]
MLAWDRYGCYNYGLCTNPKQKSITSPEETVVWDCTHTDCVCVAGTGNGTYTCSDRPKLCLPNPCGITNETAQIKCVDGLGTYNCTCKAGWTGSDCNMDMDDPCAEAPCLNVYNYCKNNTCAGTCTQELGDSTWKCNCPSGYQGPDCTKTYAIWVSTNEENLGCFNYDGGLLDSNCKKISSPMNTMDYCKQQQMTTMNPFYYRFAISGQNCYLCNNTFTLSQVGGNPKDDWKCTEDYHGTNCEHKKQCENTTCDNMGTCYEKDDGTPGCICLTSNVCTLKDDAAECIDGINGFICNCSDQWVGEHCEMNKIIQQVLLNIFGKVRLDMVPLLEELLKNPTLIKDMVSFIIGLRGYFERLPFSWNYDDMFDWIAYEDKEIIKEEYTSMWNDVGEFYLQNKGAHGHDFVIVESVRYNAEPGGEFVLDIRDVQYTRMGGKYGECISDPNKVDYFYYDKAWGYATEACLRSCYQNMINESCQCYDPRYPWPAPPGGNVSLACELEKRTCVEETIKSAGDPSTWTDCYCPLPCYNQQYLSTWTRSKFVDSKLKCYDSDNVTACKEEYDEKVTVEIRLPKLDYYIYSEIEAMTFNRFISYLGGLLGVLSGIQVITFIEFFVLFWRLFLVAVSNKAYT